MRHLVFPCKFLQGYKASFQLRWPEKENSYKICCICFNYSCIFCQFLPLNLSNYNWLSKMNFMQIALLKYMHVTYNLGSKPVQGFFQIIKAIIETVNLPFHPEVIVDIVIITFGICFHVRVFVGFIFWFVKTVTELQK